MERLPAGTSAAESRWSHTHIQVVPRSFHQPDASVSSSPLPIHMTGDYTFPHTHQQGPTGDMSYRSHKDYDLEDDLADHGSMSLAGIIKLQSDRRKGNKFWRPMQASDLGESHLDGTDQPHDDSSQQNHQAMGNSAIQLKTDSGGRHQHKEHYLAGNYLAEASRAQLFGTLPDPIQLSKQTGEFDGQVVFIGHPNRDVSAHQWSMPSFQWINIGRYSNFRGKIEGSLASDRLRGIGKPHDTLEYFKLAAENRQALVTDNGSLDQLTTLTHRGFDLGPDNAVSSQTRRDAPAVSFYNTAQIQGRTGLSLPRAASAMFTKAVLEDPFVTAANVFSSQPLSSKRISDDRKYSTGSLDLAYRFPSQTIVATSNATSNLYEQLRSGIFSGEGAECFATNVSSGSSPQEVALSEDAATQHGIIAANISSPQQRLPVSAILQRSLARSQHLEHIEASLPTSPEYEEPTSSVTRTTKAPVSRHPALSRSAAPLIYTKSALSATAIPFARPTTTATAPRASESNAGLVRYMTSGLRYSDPDGLRATQRYEVVNGLNQQAPTPQNFKVMKKSSQIGSATVTVQLGRKNTPSLSLLLRRQAIRFGALELSMKRIARRRATLTQTQSLLYACTRTFQSTLKRAAVELIGRISHEGGNLPGPKLKGWHLTKVLATSAWVMCTPAG
ncbi:hypothetical protein B5807_08072 [Epicoccum nigrum]|uniref:Uncharacterized protein n=1 Tax=Epicoccum nigrum TaxID=105696 RepID=A0A1Y2LPM9_EPING|nr:hypothetical protein B5807_08072 [Epicoccum nigrum]